MRIAICDDSLNDLDLLRTTILNHTYIRDTQVDSYTSSVEFIEKVENGTYYDIVFLDIEMPEMNGIECGHRLHRATNNTVLIFLTNFPQYALEGYECEALRYLVKPCDANKIKDTLVRALQVVEEKTHKITIKKQNSNISIKISDLYFVEYSNRHIVYHTKNETIEAGGTLENVYDKLKYYGFIQVHQGYLVNMEKIKTFKNSYVILDNGTNVIMSVRRKTEVYSEYIKYLERH